MNLENLILLLRSELQVAEERHWTAGHRAAGSVVAVRGHRRASHGLRGCRGSEPERKAACQQKLRYVEVLRSGHRLLPRGTRITGVSAKPMLNGG